jgi:hypothetical protein
MNFAAMANRGMLLLAYAKYAPKTVAKIATCQMLHLTNRISGF